LAFDLGLTVDLGLAFDLGLTVDLGLAFDLGLALAAMCHPPDNVIDNDPSNGSPLELPPSNTERASQSTQDFREQKFLLLENLPALALPC
jgi:hypothetical protein